jgi:hypothetical protein
MEDYGFEGSTPDEIWIKRLGEDAPADWIAVTADRRISRNKAARAAWIRAGLKGFVLAKGYQTTPVNQQASLILWRWPAMERLISMTTAGSMFELPVSRRAGFRPLAI